MYQIVLMIHVIVAIAIIGLVLIQHGKGADIGASFGSGASSTVFGSQGTGGFLFRMTGILAFVFFVTSLSLSSMVAMQYKSSSEPSTPQQTTAPESKIPLPVDG